MTIILTTEGLGTRFRPILTEHDTSYIKDFKLKGNVGLVRGED